MFCHHDLQDLIKRLERDGAHRVLRKLNIREGRTTIPYNERMTWIGAVIDVETTGLDASTDVIIELAVRRFRYDDCGRMLSIDRVWSWLEDPGQSLDADIERLTGLTDVGLAGQQIDEPAATRLLGSCNLIIAHNAAFDRKFVDRRLPKLAGSAWACSCSEIDWAAAGFDGRSLGWLAAQAGMFYDAHRASSDVDAVLALLSHEPPGGRTLLAELVARSATPSLRVEAIGADFGVKDELRCRGYRWDPSRKVWWKEVMPSDLPEEEGWLDRNVYGPGHRARSLEPRVIKVSARERYA